MYNILSTYAKPMEEDMSLSLKVHKKSKKHIHLDMPGFTVCIEYHVLYRF